MLGFTGFYLVLLGFTGFYRVLLGFTGFYRVLPSFTEFYLVMNATLTGWNRIGFDLIRLNESDPVVSVVFFCCCFSGDRSFFVPNFGAFFFLK